MTRSIVDWFSELVVFKSQIDSGRKIGAQRGARGAKNNIWYDFELVSMRLEPTTNTLSVLDLEKFCKGIFGLRSFFEKF